jgi:predicted metalloprotease with PDZ domain
MQTKPFIDEHLASDNQLHDFGLVLDESNPAHVKVQTVLPRSPAFYGGMRSGDEITQFNGQRINAVKDLIQTIATVAGNTTSVEVKRNGATRSLDVEFPDNNQDQARTALRPTLPSGNAPAPQHPQTAPAPNRPALPQQPRPNNPR